MGRNEQNEGKGSGLIAALAVLLSAATGVMIGFGASILAPPGLGAAAPPEPVASEVPAPASAEAPPSASAAAPPPPSPVGCLRSMFPEDTFTTEPNDLAFVCEETQAVRGATRVKEIVVKAGDDRVSGGMKEWAVLGHFGIAAFASMRARCCPDRAPLELPDAPKTCEPLADAVRKIEDVSREGAPDTEADAAIKTFRKSLLCVLKSGPKNVLGDHPAPGGGEGTTFQKTLDRTRAKR
jgi:hypothetical protein